LWRTLRAINRPGRAWTVIDLISTFSFASAAIHSGSPLQSRWPACSTHVSGQSWEQKSLLCVIWAKFKPQTASRKTATANEKRSTYHDYATLEDFDRGHKRAEGIAVLSGERKPSQGRLSNSCSECETHDRPTR
jgi:hypothetical protein